MDELIKQVTERTGISEAQARTAVDTVVGFLKTRLPAPLGTQLDALIGSGARAAGYAPPELLAAISEKVDGRLRTATFLDPPCAEDFDDAEIAGSRTVEFF